MDTTVRGVPERRVRERRRLPALLLAVAALLAGCSPGDPTKPVGGTWAAWSPADAQAARRIPRLAPTSVPRGVAPLDRETTAPIVVEPSYRAVVAQVDGEVLVNPVVVLVRRLAKPDPPARPSRAVAIGDAEGRLRATPLGTTVRWWTRGFDGIVTGAPHLEDEVLAVARGIEMPDASQIAGVRVAAVPAGYRLVSASAAPRARVQSATIRYAGEWDLSVTAQVAAGFDPLLSAVPVHADATVARKVRVRGADGILRGSTEARLGSSRRLRLLTLTWLERPNVLVSVTGADVDLDPAVLRRVAEDLRRLTPEQWARRFRRRA